MTREEKLQKAHQMFDNRNLLTELKWQRNYFNRGYVRKQEELFNLWIFDECIKALEQKSTRPKGKWISYHYGAYYECSNCHERNNSRYDNYCKFCGADMREVEE